jgi:hypothetical protein
MALVALVTADPAARFASPAGYGGAAPQTRGRHPAAVQIPAVSRIPSADRLQDAVAHRHSYADTSSTRASHPAPDLSLVEQLGNSNVHATDPLPMIVAGGGLGRSGRHVVLPAKTEIGNPWLNVANRFDSSLTTFGESTGSLDVV